MLMFLLEWYMLAIFMTISVMIIRDERTSTGLKLATLVLVPVPMIYLLLTLILQQMVFI
jgi:hypothetical protein